MRNFEERKAEIFRRGEERIYTRKVVRRVLVACVPLALCIAAAVSALPTLLRRPANAPPTATTATAPSVRECVEIRAESYYQKYTDIQTVTAVEDTLTAIINKADPEDVPAPNGTTHGETATHNSEYTITLTDEDGAATTYTLTEKRLLADKTGKEYLLSDNEATTLRILISNDERTRSVGRYLKSRSGDHMLIVDDAVTVLCDVSDLFSPFDRIKTGDKLLVFHDEIQESYPAQTNAYYCVRLESGSVDDISNTVIANLSLLGWLDPTVCYHPLAPGADESRVPFGAQYVRTNGMADVTFPSAVVIRSKAELRAYYEDYKEQFDLERREAGGFLDACDKYDDAYFEERILILARVESGSGSTRFNVTDVRVSESGTLTIDIAALTPEFITCDMAEWHIFIEPELVIGALSEENIQIHTSAIHLQ